MAGMSGLGEPIESGQRCGRGRYKLGVDDLDYIKQKLDEEDGTAPFVTFSIDDVRRNLAGGTTTTPTCIVVRLNRIIEDNPDLRAYGIRAHLSRGNVKFDYQPVNAIEQEQLNANIEQE